MASGPANGNWKGGRYLASSGYVLVRVPPGHHLRQAHGYAYEHQLVAESMLGRRLASDEVVHHRDGNKRNNARDNLVVLSCCEHGVAHRRNHSDRRLPGEPNPLVLCACGCARRITQFDRAGRRRRYVSGHNPHDCPMLATVLAYVLAGASTAVEVAAATGQTKQAAAITLSRLAIAGCVERRHLGVYGVPGSGPLKVQRSVACACGCGTEFLLYDANGRPRRYVSGHNARRRPANG